MREQNARLLNILRTRVGNTAQIQSLDYVAKDKSAMMGNLHAGSAYCPWAGRIRRHNRMFFRLAHGWGDGVSAPGSDYDCASHSQCVLPPPDCCNDCRVPDCRMTISLLAADANMLFPETAGVLKEPQFTSWTTAKAEFCQTRSCCAGGARPAADSVRSVQVLTKPVPVPGTRYVQATEPGETEVLEVTTVTVSVKRKKYFGESLLNLKNFLVKRTPFVNPASDAGSRDQLLTVDDDFVTGLPDRDTVTVTDSDQDEKQHGGVKSASVLTENDTGLLSSGQLKRKGSGRLSKSGICDSVDCGEFADDEQKQHRKRRVEHLRAKVTCAARTHCQTVRVRCLALTGSG